MLKAFEALNHQIITWRRALHAHPEVGMELPWTMEYIATVLKDLGLTPVEKGGGIVAEIEGYSPRNTVALRADADALKVKEDTGLSFSSTNGNMHACGHDGHVSMLLGVAKYLSEERNFKGKVRLLFQPDEEGGQGALSMIREGVLEGIDTIFALHGGTISTELPPGKIGFKKGAMMASVDQLEIKIKGKGCHAGYPHLGKDPVVVASECILGLQSIISREKNALEPAVLSITVLEGGRTFNVIPDEVRLEGTLRCFNEELRVKIHESLKRYVELLCESKGLMGEYLVDERITPLINDDSYVLKGIETLRETLKDEVVELHEPVFGGEDFAYYLKDVKGCFFFFNNTKKLSDGYPALHTPIFDLDESILYLGSYAMCQLVLNALND